MTTDQKLDQIIQTLTRIEERQIRTTAMVEEVEKAEPAPVGSFGSIDTGQKK